MECPFCSINDEKTRILKEYKYVRVIFSNPRLMPGHLLVIPKRHVEKISELNEKERKELFDVMIKYQEKILKHFSGCDIRQNNRSFQKQGTLKVNHLHIHLQPRKFKDELYYQCQKYETKIFKKLSENELKKYSKILR